MRIIIVLVLLGCVTSFIVWYKLRAKRSAQPVFCCVAGRSGGHIIPGVTLMYEYAKKYSGQVLFFSTATELDQTILQQYTFINYWKSVV